jgi:hypothetical protein
MLGEGSKHANTCFQQGYIGADYGIFQDLSLQVDFKLRNPDLNATASTSKDEDT